MNKLLSVALAALLLVCCTVTALAETVTIDGDFTVTTDDPDCYTVADSGDIRTITLKTGADVTFAGNGSGYGILVPSDATDVTIRLNGLKMDYAGNSGYGAHPIALESGAEATVVLNDGTTNELAGNNEASAIRVPQGSSLTITGSGTLNAWLNNGNAATGSAVIGSQYSQPYGSIYIFGGTINADPKGYSNAAGIGTAYDNFNYVDESTEPGMIVIRNAVVNTPRIGGVMPGFEQYNNVIIYNTADINGLNGEGEAAINARRMIEDENGNFSLPDGAFDLVGSFTLEQGQSFTVAEDQQFNILPGAEFVQNGTMNNNGRINYGSQVACTVAPSYTVTIPESVTLGGTATISAEGVVVDKGQQVEVRLTGTSGADNAFTLQTAEGATLDYAITSGETPINVGDTVLTVNPDTSAAGSAALSFKAPESAFFAGNYSGTVTFTVSVEAAGV